ncbi:hypothetical protein [Acidovorax sp. CCYZU-2555]|uniref:hypothetical protein n=1 Tax=Acidovorax sp. CCYZU-2555 TaxID=2835042 RepID=UPI001BCCFC69|nr:hypothetical protein [Acidovorax sp. CCYZU-2555]MBS7780759.1 hypothetical protein [Acidovorax sp. CCYZU-2555]
MPLDNVDFEAIVGAARIVGGDDPLGSKNGDDQIYGDAGNHLLLGGSASDKLKGGTGFDVALQEGKRSDYSIMLDGAGTKITHIASGVTVWLVDVVQVRFETGPTLILAHGARPSKPWLSCPSSGWDAS